MRIVSLLVLFAILAQIVGAAPVLAAPPDQIAIGCDHGSYCFYRLIPVKQYVNNVLTIVRYDKLWTCVCKRPRTGR